MNIFVTGGSGFVGRALVVRLLADGHQITVLGRSTPPLVSEEGINYIQGDPVQPGAWQEKMLCHDAVINLAGSSINCRWNQSNRRSIRDSRIISTRNIVDVLHRRDSLVKVVLNGSAVGFYGDRGDEELDETSSGGSDFLSETCKAWEAEARCAEELGVRVVRCRLGVVLGKNGGALGKMIPPFRAGFGARLGSGRQWFPWIHQSDLIRIFAMLLESPGISGAINCVAPDMVDNRTLTRLLAEALGRPLLLPAVPALFLRLVQGEASAILLNSTKVVPRRLENLGFIYQFSTLSSALAELL